MKSRVAVGKEVGAIVSAGVTLIGVLVGLGVRLGTVDGVAVGKDGVKSEEMFVGFIVISLPVGFSSVSGLEEVWQLTAKEISRISNQLYFRKDNLYNIWLTFLLRRESPPAHRDHLHYCWPLAMPSGLDHSQSDRVPRQHGRGLEVRVQCAVNSTILEQH